MKKLVFWSMLLLSILGLIACAPETAEESDSISAESGGQPADSAAVSEPLEVGENFPASEFAQAAEERAVDYAKGAEDPVLTVIEYGDFQ